MDDKGYAFTPMAFLLIIPVMVLAVSFNGVINELNTISAIAVGGDVTVTIANNIITAVEQDTADAGRNSAMGAVQTVINRTNTYGAPPFFGQTGNNSTGNNSKAFIVNSTVTMLNKNITQTCRVLEKQTGRNISINNVPVDPDGTDSLTIFTVNNLTITQSDPYGFYITVSGVPIKVVQNDSSNQTIQSVQFNTPVRNVYVSIEKLEDPYIWVNTKERNSSVIYRYPYFTSSGAIVNSPTGDYHFADKVSNHTLNYLWECLDGPNATAMGPRSYYFPDVHGLSFFDRLEGRLNDSSGSPPSARMSTFILYDPIPEDHGNYNISTLDHEYFAKVLGYPLTTTHGTSTGEVLDPTGKAFLISTNYRGYLFNNQINFPY